ncbi:Ig-like domain-containing protein [Hymenobacter guriensis]|uniref:chitinase n=1 Tax=Hymenobacter guriensis TaxID=2793065 RepID=A0ABS0L260_9BACT|nr:Ig-like domain-containing protein [Hymenobacter guriensis]MBG8554197.1 carbohydrate-binding protein [Hymenobacter guriensis]
MRTAYQTKRPQTAGATDSRLQRLRNHRLVAFLLFIFAFMCGNASAQTACSPAWSSSTVYTVGNPVSRNGNNYTAKWWTQGEDPTTASCTDCVWKLVGPCGGTTTNTPPTVGLTAPANGASYTAPATITLGATATDNVSVAKVEFFNGSTKLGEDLTAPYSYTWGSVAAGTYTLTAKATDNAGLTATSAAATVTVTAAPPVGIAIPGQVEAEAYSAFNNVQLETTTDTNGGQNVGYIAAGSWMDYAVNVTTAGQYDVTYRVASLNTASSVQLRSGATVLGTTSVPVTGSWQTWTTTAATRVTLAAGAQTLRVYAVAPGFNLNWIRFAAAGSTTNTPPTVGLTAPANGATFTAPASVTITATATDNVSVAKVEFFNGSTKLGEDLTAPYSYTWGSVAAGTYTLTAKATDNAGLTATSAAVSITVNGTTTPTTNLPKRIMSGYWHNFAGGVPFIKLRDVHPGWDVINISFAEPIAAGSTDGRMKFVLGGPADYTPAAFKADVKLLQSQGKKVVLSIGGYEGYFSLGSTTAVNQFVTDIKSFVNEYGFDGIDIDLEQSSVQFNGGADPDFKNPTSPKVVNMISAIRQIVNAYPSTFILSWAPETFYFPMAHQWYGGTNSFVDTRSGVYLPMIQALRDRTTYVQTQLYNSAQMKGNDGVMYSMGTVEGIVAMTNMVIEGFTVGSDTGPFFTGLRPDQIVIAVPSSQGAAGSGQISNAGLQQAFNQVNSKHPGLRGIMAWSINWDTFQNSNSFVISNSNFLKALPAARTALSDQPAVSRQTGLGVFPNPAVAGNRLSLKLGAKYQSVDVLLTDLTGRRVGAYSFRSVSQADFTLPKHARGILLVQVVADGKTTVQRILAE